ANCGVRVHVTIRENSCIVCRRGGKCLSGSVCRMTYPRVLAAGELPHGQTRPLHLLWSVERALRLETRAVETQLGFSAAQLWALSKLAESPGMSLSALARRLGTHESSA